MLERMVLKTTMIVLLGLVTSSCNKHFINCDVTTERCQCACVNIETLKEVDPKECKDDWDKYFYGTPTNQVEQYEPEKCNGIHGFFDRDIFDEIIPLINKERQRCEDKSK